MQSIVGVTAAVRLPQRVEADGPTGLYLHFSRNFQGPREPSQGEGDVSTQSLSFLSAFVTYSGSGNPKISILQTLRQPSNRMAELK